MLRALAAPLEDVGSIPCTHSSLLWYTIGSKIVCNSSTRDLQPDKMPIDIKYLK